MCIGRGGGRGGNKEENKRRQRQKKLGTRLAGKSRMKHIQLDSIEDEDEDDHDPEQSDSVYTS